MITLELTDRESRLVQAAINAEIIKGAGTFLSPSDVITLADILSLLKSKNLDEESA